jgi:sialate O-acetylesterase
MACSGVRRFGVFVLAVVSLAFSDCWPVLGAVRLPAVIADGMVLQRDQANPIWGWATPEREVTVSIASQTAKATADKEGRFKVTIGPVATGGPYELTVQEAAGTLVTVKNVLIGEVWLCSGQSNMWWSVARAKNAAAVTAGANYPNIRFFTMTTPVADKPQDNCTGRWAICSSHSVPDFSAVAYEFLRQIHEQLKVPCGMLQCTIGGAPAEAWIERARLEQVPCILPLLERWKKGKAVPNDAIWQPGGLYNGSLLPLAPYGLRGFIWYQGESNSARAFQYREMFPLLIANWREIWGKQDMPFGFVQIAPYNYPVPPHDGWDKYVPELRQSQLETWQKVPGTGMVVTMDIGDVNDIHPARKQEVGRRMSLWAMSQVYGKPNVVYSGPIYRSMTVKGGQIRLQFDHLGSGLSTRDGKAPSHFTVAAADHNFVPAQAAIDGCEVVVWADGLSAPVAVRYGWCHHVEPNLCNKEGLPASPFRTDDWRWLTEANN